MPVKPLTTTELTIVDAQGRSRLHHTIAETRKAGVGSDPDCPISVHAKVLGVLQGYVFDLVAFPDLAIAKMPFGGPIAIKMRPSGPLNIAEGLSKATPSSDFRLLIS